MSVSMTMESVLNTLKKEMASLIKPERIALCSPADIGDKILVGIFVYYLARDVNVPFSGNIRVEASVSQKPPVVMEARIMVTAYASKKSELLDDLKLLENMAIIFHEVGEVSISTPLQPAYFSLPRIEPLHICMDEISKIWQFPNLSYLPSLFYKIAPIVIPSQKTIVRAPVASLDFGG